MTNLDNLFKNKMSEAYSGSAVIAMAGEKCVAIASDHRFPDHRFGARAQTVSFDNPKVFRMGPRLCLGVAGLVTDIQTVVDNTRSMVNLYELSHHRRMKPSTLTGALSNALYQKRFGPYYVESVVAGLQPKTSHPYLASLDLLGSSIVRDDFVANGTCKMQLLGMCETLWKPQMDAESLFETISQALLNACDRDAISGWGATVHVIEPKVLTVRTLRTRMD